MRITPTEKGFTVLEIIVVIGILAVITAISAVAFQNMYQVSALRAGGDEVYGALTDARTKTLTSQNDTVYGVLVSSTTVTRFDGATYVAGAGTNKTYSFEGGASATGTPVVSETPIVFTRLSGIPNEGGTIYVRNIDGTNTTTILIHASGLIEYE